MTVYATNRPLRMIAAGLCLLPILAGCGQKGPLFLPGDRSEMQTEIPLPGGDRSEDGQDDEDDGADEDDR